MSFSDDSSDSELLSNLNNVTRKHVTSPSSKRKETKRRQTIKRIEDSDYFMDKSRPYFVDRWLDRFKPWLARDKVDPQKPFCEACRCRVNCNKLFHLKRHERTSKHQSNLITYLKAKGLQLDMQNCDQRKSSKERKKKTPKVKTKRETDASKFESVFIGIDILDKVEKEEFKCVSTQKAMPDIQHTVCENEDGNESGSTTLLLYDMESIPSQKKNEQFPPSGKDEYRNDKRLLLEIQKVKNEIIAAFNDLFSQASFDKRERNHVDLFFDSVSSSIKRLPPKLVAESKMRVSQLLCEMEMRAITESESNATADSLVVISAPLGDAYIVNNGGPTTNGGSQVGSSQHDASCGAKD